jgi:hypothetical protein
MQPLLGKRLSSESSLELVKDYLRHSGYLSTLASLEKSAQQSHNKHIKQAR